MRIIAFDRRSTGRRRAAACRAGGAGLMALSETITIEAAVAACDGGCGALGHPKVYLNLAPSGMAECPYCSRRFINRAMLAGGGREASDAGSPLGDRGAPRA
jgi:uncharacterized Zn-finger protein